jgi:hypothetical protein
MRNLPLLLSEHKHLMKSSHATFCPRSLLWLGSYQLSLQIIEHSCAYVTFLLASHNPLPTCRDEMLRELNCFKTKVIVVSWNWMGTVQITTILRFLWGRQMLDAQNWCHIGQESKKKNCPIAVCVLLVVHQTEKYCSKGSLETNSTIHISAKQFLYKFNFQDYNY